MTYDPLTTRRRRKVVAGVLTVGILVSTLVAIALYYMSQARPHF